MLNQISQFNTCQPLQHDKGIQRIQDANNLFSRMLLSAKVKALLSKVKHNNRGLFCPECVENKNEKYNQHYVGAKAVALIEIRGSINKAESKEFDIDFLPLQERSRKRWRKLCAAILAGCTIPPVELRKMGNVYYVIDGHHRVSVYKALGMQYIDAIVIG
jgi:hypothetical protein